MNYMLDEINKGPSFVKEIDTISRLNDFLEEASLKVNFSGRFVIQNGTENEIDLDEISIIFSNFVEELSHELYPSREELDHCFQARKKIKQLYQKSQEEIDKANRIKAYFLRWCFEIDDSDELDPSWEPRQLVLDWKNRDERLELLDSYPQEEASTSGICSSGLQINKTVSILYFPRSNKLAYGHVKLRVGDEAWALIDFQKKAEATSQYTFEELKATNRTNDCSMVTNLIKNASQGRKPFYEFMINVEPEVYTSLHKKAWKERSFSCSLGALNSIANHGGYSVPYVFRLTPLISAIYLFTAKAFSSEAIHEIKFYGSPDSAKNVSQCVRGVVLESLLLCMITYCAYFAIACSSNIFYPNYR